MAFNFDFVATQQNNSQGLSGGLGWANSLKTLVSKIDLQAPAQIGETIDFGRIPTNARISSRDSAVAYSDLHTTGTPTIDIGLVGIGNSVAIDDDCFIADIEIGDAGAISLLARENPERFGLKAWEFIDGLAEDPGGEFMVVGTIKDLATDTTGSIHLQLYYTLD